MPKKAWILASVGAGALTLGLAAPAVAQTQSDTTQQQTPAQPAAPAASTPEGVPAPAAPATPVVPAAQPQSGQLQEIVVTAQKRAENLQNVPVSVTAVSGAAVDKLKATTLEGLQGTIPNIQINNFSNTPNSAVFTIRGIGVVDPDPFAGNTVSIVLDGVPQYFSMGSLLDLFDVERVEVLRGPQGTLFGANTTGGVVNVVTAQPTGEFGGKAELTYGNYNRFDIKGALNFPIVKDVLAGKIDFMHTQQDGFVTNVVNGKSMGDRNVEGYRGYLKFTPSSNFDATLIGEYDNARNGAPVVVNGDYPGEATYVAPGTGGMYQQPCRVPTERCHAPDKYYSANDSTPDISNMNTYRLTFTMNWRDTGIGDFTAITGYKKFNLLEYTDQDGTPKFLDDTRRYTTAWQFSQEIRDDIKLTDGIRLLVGGFYLKDHYNQEQDFRIQFAAPGLLQINTQDQGNYSISAFAQTYVDITRKLQLQAGIRYTHERTHMIADTQNSINLSSMTQYDGAGNIPLTASSFIAEGAKSWNNVGWKLGLNYKVTNAAMIYGYWARGFKSGGFVGRISLPQDLGPFGPEHVDTFEVGLKADFLDHHLRTNLDGFYTNYRDIQVAQTYFTTDASGNRVNSTTIQNAASAHIKGFELEVTALPVDHLTLTGSVAYLDAKYNKFNFFDGTTGTYISLAGYPLQNAPKWGVSAGFNYDLPLGPADLSFGMSYHYTSKKYLNAINDTPRALVQPTNYIDANIDFTPTNSWWSIGLWGKNLLNHHYIASVYDAPGTIGLVNYTPPREYGVTVKAHF